jgi:hypothetical protein
MEWNRVAGIEEMHGVVTPAENRGVTIRKKKFSENFFTRISAGTE